VGNTNRTYSNYVVTFKYRLDGMMTGLQDIHWAEHVLKIRHRAI